MESKELEYLKEEIRCLSRKIDILTESFETMTSGTTSEILEIYKRIKSVDGHIRDVDKRELGDFNFFRQHIADLHEIVAPIEQKIFPDAKNTRKQLASIVGPKRLGDGKDFDKKKG